MFSLGPAGWYGHSPCHPSCSSSAVLASISTPRCRACLVVVTRLLSLTLGWCSLCIAIVSGGGGGVTVYRYSRCGCRHAPGCAVVLLIEMVSVFLGVGGGGDDSQVGPGGCRFPACRRSPRWSLLVPVVPSTTWLLLSSPLPPWSHLGSGRSCRHGASQASRIVVVPAPVLYT
jgi:hypothetical protein